MKLDDLMFGFRDLPSQKALVGLVSCDDPCSCLNVIFQTAFQIPLKIAPRFSQPNMLALRRG